MVPRHGNLTPGVLAFGTSRDRLKFKTRDLAFRDLALVILLHYAVCADCGQLYADLVGLWLVVSRLGPVVKGAD